MNKSDLVDALASSAGMTKADAAHAVDLGCTLHATAYTVSRALRMRWERVPRTVVLTVVFEAALSLALVNEALYALYPESTPNIKSFFQNSARRHAEFRLQSTCGFTYVGITRSVVKSIAQEKQRVQERATFLAPQRFRQRIGE